MRPRLHGTLALAALIGLSMGCASSPTRREPPPARAAVTSADLQDPNEPIERGLQRKVPGLQVTRTPDGGIALQIRGSSSYTGADTPPLYVLDGLPFHPGPGGALTGINPNEIESVKVLKGADAGLYGIEGANGVIAITTKKPGKKRG